MEKNNLGKMTGYLRGLMEGMEFSDPAQEKLMQAMADLLAELSDRVENIDDLLDDLNDYVESIDDDLSELESERGGDLSFFDEDYDDEDEDFLDDLNSKADHLHLIGGKDDIDSADEPQTLEGAICPDCEHMFFVDADDPEDAVYACPHCGHSVTPVPLSPENAPIARPIEQD